VHGPGIDEPLARGSSAGLIRFYHLDGLGSLVKMTDTGGNVEGSRSYDSFGQAPTAPSSGYAFTSREWDSESGLYYYRARYYDPQLGRFISEDPVDYGNGLTGYAYVLSNPANLVDPSGLTAQDLLPCGGACPPSVEQARQETCANAAKIPDAAARQCVQKQCGYYPHPIKMTCNGAPCSMANASGYNTGGSFGSLNSIVRPEPQPLHEAANCSRDVPRVPSGRA
jgi:RHS repeat-associated protein